MDEELGILLDMAMVGQSAAEVTASELPSSPATSPTAAAPDDVRCDGNPPHHQAAASNGGGGGDCDDGRGGGGGGGDGGGGAASSSTSSSSVWVSDISVPTFADLEDENGVCKTVRQLFEMGRRLFRSLC
jgi:hypothetical protein